MREQLNCPNCGAPITGCECEYCGTVFYDFAVLSDEKPTYIRLNLGGKQIVAKAKISEAKLTGNLDKTSFYCDDRIYQTMSSMSYHLELGMDFYSDCDGTMFTIQDLNRK